MAKDDYHVIVYQILAYLYGQLKKGGTVNPSAISHNGELFEINYSYWLYIMENLLNEGYVTGISITDNSQVRGLGKCKITPKGIEYICNDNMLDKVMDYIRGRKDIPTSI